MDLTISYLKCLSLLSLTTNVVVHEITVWGTRCAYTSMHVFVNVWSQIKHM